MISFRNFLSEAGTKTLFVFDIDDTLFKTSARIKVIKNGKTIKFLDSTQFNDYKLKSDETFDFGEFRSAETFRLTAKPIDNVIEKAKEIIGESIIGGDKVIFLTARADFDDKKKFIKVFATHGIDIRNHVFVERAGNLNLGSAAKNKRFILHKYIKSDEYRRIVLFDDSISNITMFKALAKQYKKLKFDIYLITDKGKIRKQ